LTDRSNGRNRAKIIIATRELNQSIILFDSNQDDITKMVVRCQARVHVYIKPRFSPDAEPGSVHPASPKPPLRPPWPRPGAAGAVQGCPSRRRPLPSRRQVPLLACQPWARSLPPLSSCGRFAVPGKYVMPAGIVTKDCTWDRRSAWHLTDPSGPCMLPQPILNSILQAAFPSSTPALPKAFASTLALCSHLKVIEHRGPEHRLDTWRLRPLPGEGLS